MRQTDVSFSLYDTRINISFWFVSILTFYAVFSGNAAEVFGAVILHELSHVFAILLFGGNIVKVSLTIGEIGIVPDTLGFSPAKCIFVSAAGPLSNIIASIIAFSLGNNSYGDVNIVIGLFQLLPVATLDGGEVFRLLFSKFRFYKCLSVAVSFLLSFIILFLGITAFMNNRYNFSLLIAGLYILFLQLNQLKQ